MQTKLTVITSQRQEKHYDGNRKVVYFTAKGIFHDPDGGVDVGTLRVPESLVKPEILSEDGSKIREGDYVIDFKARRSYSDDSYSGGLCLFNPIHAKPQQAAAPAKS